MHFKTSIFLSMSYPSKALISFQWRIRPEAREIKIRTTLQCWKLALLKSILDILNKKPIERTITNETFFFLKNLHFTIICKWIILTLFHFLGFAFLKVLRTAQKEFLNHGGSGISVMGMLKYNFCFHQAKCKIWLFDKIIWKFH